MALLLGVDFLVDMACTAVNVVGNSLAAAVVDTSEKRGDAKCAECGLGAASLFTDTGNASQAPTGNQADRRVNGSGPDGAAAEGHHSPASHIGPQTATRH